jgi:hypothetical protein
VSLRVSRSHSISIRDVQHIVGFSRADLVQSLPL